MVEPISRAARRAATASRILEAARLEFGDRGMEAATIRGIAARAGVDPSLVLQHFGSKQGLFAAAVGRVEELGDQDVPEHLAAVLDARLRELPAPARALMRSMLTSQEVAGAMRAFLQDRADALAAATPSEGAELQAALAVSSVLGITIARHFLELPALVGADDEGVAAFTARLLPGG